MRLYTLGDQTMQRNETPLMRRLSDRQPQPKREPEWLRRMREQGLPAKEMPLDRAA